MAPKIDCKVVEYILYMKQVQIHGCSLLDK